MSEKSKKNPSAATRVYVNKVFGFELPITVPSTVEEVAKILGDMEEVWRTSIQTLLYRRWNPEFREQFCEELTARTGMEREQAVDTNGNPLFLPGRKEGSEPEPKLETEQAFLNRVILAGKITSEEAEQLAREISSNIPVDFTPRTRELKPSTQNRKDAQSFLAAFENGSKNANEFVTKWETKLGTSFPGNPLDVNDLARAFKLLEEHVKRSSTAGF
jgi:hypothetical protein